jgi:hypothetical protein
MKNKIEVRRMSKKKRTQFLLDDRLKEKVKKNNVSERVDQP